MPQRSEIYLVNFDPGRGHEQRGMRPALVIQNDIGNEYAGTTIIAGLSTREASGPYQVGVSPRESGLRESSTVMLDQLLTVDQSRLRQLLGRLSPGAMSEVDRAIHVSLGLVH